MKRWQYEAFVAKFDDKTIELACVTFALGADGKVEGDETRQSLLLPVTSGSRTLPPLPRT